MAYHFFRGTGIAGLSGISGRRDNIVRPLINCSRGDLRLFLREAGVPWREDETNEENHYTRNKIRNQLLPWVRSNINESADRVLLGLADESASLAEASKNEASVSLALISRYHPFAMASWDTPAVRRLSPLQLSAAVREQAAMLSLPAIDRKRLVELCRLITGGSGWRFQWAGDVEVCGDNSMIGWITRGLLIPPAAADVPVSIGERVTVEWGAFSAEFELKRREPAECRKTNVWSAFIPSCRDSCSVAISSVHEFIKKNNFAPSVKIPWWSAHNTPIISWKGDNIIEAWLPGTRNAVRNYGDYVIIAKVFAQLRSDY
jgi:hypothetical protein